MATNHANATYTEIIDLQTTNGKTTVLGIHTPVGDGPYTRLRGFFDQFRKFKYNGIVSLRMVPAAQLPVDPMGLTGIQGSTDLMDPRDALNPIIFHGAHGENLSNILNTIYSSMEFTAVDNHRSGNIDTTDNTLLGPDSVSKWDVTNTASDMFNYYRCLTDKTWKKYGIQSGVSIRMLHPLVHKLAINRPIVPGWSDDVNVDNAGEFSPASLNQNNLIQSSALGSTVPDASLAYRDQGMLGVTESIGAYVDGTRVNTLTYMQEFTNGMTRLGWLPTTRADSTGYKSIITILPKLFMGVLILPPAYNVEQFFRLAITHSFSFKEFTSSLGAMGTGFDTPAAATSTVSTPSYFNWIDYTVSAKETEASSLYVEGTTLDVIGGDAKVVSDGVL